MVYNIEVQIHFVELPFYFREYEEFARSERKGLPTMTTTNTTDDENILSQGD